MMVMEFWSNTKRSIQGLTGHHFYSLVLTKTKDNRHGHMIERVTRNGGESAGG